MKSKLITLSMIALLAITSISCSKDEPAATPTPAPVVVNPPTPTPTGPFVKATIDGIPFANDFTAQAVRLVAGAEIQISVVGSNLTADANSRSRSIRIDLRYITAPGTYTVAQNSNIVGSKFIKLTHQINAPDNSFQYFTTGTCSTAGTVTITAIDATKIEGNFSFTGSDFDQSGNCSTIKTITAGSFRGIF